MTPFLVVLALQATSSAPQPAPASSGKPTIMVLTVRDNGVGPQAVETIAETIVAHLSTDARLQVTSMEDVRRLVEMHGAKLAAGCDGNDACMAEIAEALGAQLTVHATAGRLGELVVVNVSLFDARRGTTVGRELVEVGALEALPGPLRAATDRLIDRLGLARDGPGPLLIGAAALGTAGVALGVMGAALWVPNIDGYKSAQNVTFDDKSQSRLLERTGLALAAAGVGALGVGATLAGLSFAFE